MRDLGLEALHGGIGIAFFARGSQATHVASPPGIKHFFHSAADEDSSSCCSCDLYKKTAMSTRAVKNPINLHACFARVPRFWDFHCYAMPCPKKIRLREDLEGISTQTSTNHNASQYVSPITWGFPRHPKRKVLGWTSAGINWLPAPKYHFATAKRPLLTTKVYTF